MPPTGYTADPTIYAFIVNENLKTITLEPADDVFVALKSQPLKAVIDKSMAAAITAERIFLFIICYLLLIISVRIIDTPTHRCRRSINSGKIRANDHPISSSAASSPKVTIA